MENEDEVEKVKYEPMSKWQVAFYFLKRIPAVALLMAFIWFQPLWWCALAYALNIGMFMNGFPRGGPIAPSVVLHMLLSPLTMFGMLLVLLSGLPVSII